MLLDRIQRNFPLAPQPYLALSQGLSITEEDVRGRIAQLKRERIVRQISGIFNTGALGYRSSLVAMAVPAEHLETTAAVVNAYPGVSHNYLREASYNMWYTIAVPPGQSLEGKVRDLARESGGWSALVLPAVRKYKLAVVLDLLEEGDAEAAEERGRMPALEATTAFQPIRENVLAVRVVQEDLPLASHPFEDWAHRLGMSEPSLLELLADWMTRGYMRRFAAVLNHRQVGFGGNGMVVWSCPEERLDQVGPVLATHQEVSHCYHRPAYPEWPYNLYAMVHGRTREDCEVAARRLGASVDLMDYRILFSSREFKKIRLKLFWD
jgi:DNA-binding Lrp family transcriptional regulator